MYLLIQIYSLSKTWLDDRAARRQLQGLNDRLLADLGIARDRIEETVRTASRAVTHQARYVGDLPQGEQRWASLRAHLQPAYRSVAA